MADHAKPILTDNYTDVLSQIRGRFEDQAKGFDPANTTATNITTGTIRWNSAEKKFQKWSGTAWGDLTDNYVLSGATFSTGTANGVAYLNGSKVLTTGSALTFDGTNLGVIGNSSATVQSSVRNDNTATNAGAKFATLYTSTEITSIGHYWDGSQFLSRFNSLSDLLFTRNNVEQMRLTSTGLGIGTSSPGTRLDVNGVIRSVGNSDLPSSAGSNALYAGGFNSPYSGQIFIGDGSGWQYAISKRSGGVNTPLFIFQDSGNLGLGVTPSAWSASAKAIQFGAYGAVYQNASGYPELAFNVFQNASNSYIYRNTDVATRYSQTNGAHQWFTAPSGTAGSAISFTQAMTLDANGKLILSAANQGIQFADGTTQTTAGINPATAAAGAIGTMAMCKYTGTGSVTFGTTKNASELQYSDASGQVIQLPVAGNTWRCLGMCNDTSEVKRVTIWVRVS